jgi:ribosomal 50S subunit-recycling heat shock protein
MRVQPLYLNSSNRGHERNGLAAECKREMRADAAAYLICARVSTRRSGAREVCD